MTIPISLLAAHFVGDFVLQSDFVAINKSKSWKVLLFHCLIYSACFLPWGWKFAVVTFYLHFVTDWVTSRITSKLWFFERRYYGADMPIDLSDDWYYVEGKRHWFFVTVGADQLIHYVTLAWTLKLLS